jgi:hypothetical protein
MPRDDVQLTRSTRGTTPAAILVLPSGQHSQCRLCSDEGCGELATLPRSLSHARPRSGGWRGSVSGRKSSAAARSTHRSRGGFAANRGVKRRSWLCAPSRPGIGHRTSQQHIAQFGTWIGERAAASRLTAATHCRSARWLALTGDAEQICSNSSFERPPTRRCRSPLRSLVGSALRCSRRRSGRRSSLWWTSRQVQHLSATS